MPGVGGAYTSAGPSRGGVVLDPFNRSRSSSSAGPVATGQNSANAYKGILDSLSKLGGSGGGVSSPPPPAITRNVATANPDLRYATDRMRTLDKTYEEGDPRSVNRLGRALADFGQGQKARLAAGRTARGVSGTGVDDLQNQRVESDIGRQFASGAADIELGVRDKQQQVLRDIAGAGSSAAGIAQGDKNLALAQNEAQMRRWEAVQAAEERAKDRQISLALQAISLLPAM